MFFFGKKEPKNFSPFGAARLGLSAANGESLFASFSSEKEESLLTIDDQMEGKNWIASLALAMTGYRYTATECLAFPAPR
jgi:hypothetical protein